MKNIPSEYNSHLFLFSLYRNFKIVNHLNINFTKLIAKTKNKNTIYYHDKNKNFQKIGIYLPFHLKKKDGGLNVIRANKIETNYGNNNLIKNRILRKGNLLSENKRNKKLINIPLIKNDIFINNIYKKK